MEDGQETGLEKTFVVTDNVGGPLEVAAIIGVSFERFLELIKREDFPEPVVGEDAKWDIEEIISWDALFKQRG